MKGQISVEYLTLTSILLLVVGLMFAFALVSVNENAKFNKAYYTTREMVNAADEVSTRNGSTIVVEVELPSEVTEFSTFGNEVNIKLGSVLSSFDVYDLSKASLEPTNFDTSEGTHFIAIKSTDTNVTFTELN